MKPIVLIKTGSTIPQILSAHGDFEAWFAAGMGIPGLPTIDVSRMQPLPLAEDLRGVVITGSAAMVSAREAWSEKTAAWLKGAVAGGLPVLGVCYGHQLLAHALGGRVGPNPAGRQIGTVTAQLLDGAGSDPLLGGLPRVFAAQTSHSEKVLEMPPGAERLAGCPLDENFAIRFGERVWGVQFHPEFSAQVTMEYIRYRAEALRAEGLDPELLLANVTDTPAAASVLRRFVDLIGGPPA